MEKYNPWNMLIAAALSLTASPHFPMAATNWPNWIPMNFRKWSTVWKPQLLYLRIMILSPETIMAWTAVWNLFTRSIPQNKTSLFHNLTKPLSFSILAKGEGLLASDNRKAKDFPGTTLIQSKRNNPRFPGYGDRLYFTAITSDQWFLY